jgi:hypothetical protein
MSMESGPCGSMAFAAMLGSSGSWPWKCLQAWVHVNAGPAQTSCTQYENRSMSSERPVSDVPRAAPAGRCRALASSHGLHSQAHPDATISEDPPKSGNHILCLMQHRMRTAPDPSPRDNIPRSTSSLRGKAQSNLTLTQLRIPPAFGLGTLRTSLRVGPGNPNAIHSGPHERTAFAHRPHLAAALKVSVPLESQLVPIP